MKNGSLIVLLLVLSACVDTIPQKPEPDQLIEREEMVNILTDLSFLEAAYQLKYVQVAKYSDQLKKGGDSILRAHHTTFEIFDANMNYYGSDQTEMTAIYNDVKTRLETRRKELELLEQEERD